MHCSLKHLAVFTALAGFFYLAPNAAADFMGEDVVVLMDSSGSITSAGWAGEVSFVEQLDSDMPNRSGTRLAVIQFATTVITRYNLTDNQSPSIANAAIASIPYLQGSTYVKDAVQSAINLFAAQSDPLDPKVLILVTDDGDPNPQSSQNPSSLTSDLQSAGITFLTATWETPYPVYATMTSDTGGAEYQYSFPFTGSTADQFLSDASAYFGLGELPEPGSLSLTLAAGIIAFRRPHRRLRQSIAPDSHRS
jgi:hypothetical protein